VSALLRLSCAALLGALLLSVRASGAPASDGTYFGYEFMANLSPEEDPDAQWFHANVLTIRGANLTIEKAPRYISKGEVVASASDGGFYSFIGSIIDSGGRTIVAMHLKGCDNCAVPVPEHGAPTGPTEYVVRFWKDGSFELDHVHYRRHKDARFELRAST